jgi:hypothetical protein
MRMLNFYINRAGKNLSKERAAELEKAKQMLSDKIASLKNETATKTPAKNQQKA